MEHGYILGLISFQWIYESTWQIIIPGLSAYEDV